MKPTRPPKPCRGRCGEWVTPPAQWCDNCRIAGGVNPLRKVSLLDPDSWDDDV